MLRDPFGSPEDHEAAMTYAPPAPLRRPFVVCRRCLRDDADTNQAACRCCGGELHRFGRSVAIHTEREYDPAIEVTVDWPGESLRERCARWAPVFDILDRFAHVRQSRVTVSCDDPDGDVEVRVRYLPNRQEIACHTGCYECDDEVPARGFR